MEETISICPFRMTKSPPTVTAVLEGLRGDLDKIRCLEYHCAWWNDDFGACAVQALSITATQPTVMAERQMQ